MSGGKSAQDVELPDELLTRVEDRVQYTEFESAADYIEHVVGEVLHHVESVPEESNREVVDEDEVQERLESLGYLNE